MEPLSWTAVRALWIGNYTLVKGDKRKRKNVAGSFIEMSLSPRRIEKVSGDRGSLYLRYSCGTNTRRVISRQRRSFFDIPSFIDVDHF